MTGLKSILSSYELDLLRRCVAGDEDLYSHRQLYDKLIDWYCDEIPVSVQKARTGDPVDWLMEFAERDLQWVV